MKIHEYSSTARKKKKRIGRGNASGHGTYSGRGVKGQNARTGGGVRIGFEGGQTPFLRRIPKLRGFKHPNPKVVAAFNVSSLQKIFSDGDTVTPEILREKKLISNNCNSVKILGNGEITISLNCKNVLCSQSAKTKITAAGGTVEEIQKAKKQ